MPQTYDREFKTRVVSDIKDAGLSAAEAARKYRISPHTVYRWLQADATGSDEVLKLRKRVRLLEGDLEAMTRLVKKLSLEAGAKKKI